MSMVSKLARMAQKKLAQQGSGSSTSGSGQTDWKALVRTASDAITGDGKNGRPGQGGTGATGGYGGQRGPGSQGGQRGHDSQRGYDDPGGYDRRGGHAPTAAGPARPGSHGAPQQTRRAPSGSQTDRAAVARYDYLLQTADPHQVEQVHREAFERLTPAQRSLVEARMQEELPQGERPRSSSPDDLARAAARTEAREPGLLKGLLARVGTRDPRGGSSSGGLGRGAAVGGAAAAGLAAGGLLTVVAGGAVLSSVAGPLLEQAVGAGVDFDAIAGGVDLEGIASGLDITGGVDELANGAGEAVSGFGEQIKDLGSGFGIPGLDDLLGR